MGRSVMPMRAAWQDGGIYGVPLMLARLGPDSYASSCLEIVPQRTGESKRSCPRERSAHYPIGIMLIG